MSYLLTQMFLYMLATFLLGLFIGWLIWRKSDTGTVVDTSERDAERNALIAERDGLRAQLRSTQRDLEVCESNLSSAVAAPVAVAASVAMEDAAPAESSKPQGIAGPRGGVADNLQDISGVGPKLEKLLHDLGFYHFDQIANWTDAEVAWVDQNLEGFFGRVTRDKWIEQARVLAAK